MCYAVSLHTAFLVSLPAVFACFCLALSRFVSLCTRRCSGQVAVPLHKGFMSFHRTPPTGSLHPAQPSWQGLFTRLCCHSDRLVRSSLNATSHRHLPRAHRYLSGGATMGNNSGRSSPVLTATPFVCRSKHQERCSHLDLFAPASSFSLHLTDLEDHGPSMCMYKMQ